MEFLKMTVVHGLRNSVFQDPEKPMDRFNQMWYNAIVNTCHLSPQQFQLFQGSETIVNTNDLLWNVFDSLPPKTVNNYYDPTLSNFFTDNYEAVLSKLKTNPALGDLQTFLGPDLWTKYQIDWQEAHQAAIKNGTKLTRTDFYHDWCRDNCPGKCSAGTKIITQLDLDPLLDALERFDDAKLANLGYAYTADIKKILKDVDTMPGLVGSLDTSTASSSVSQTWAGSSSSFDFFYSSESSQTYHDLLTKIYNSRVTVKVTIDHLLTVQAGPLDKPMPNTPYLKKYTPWYHSTILGLAFNDRSNEVWEDPTQHPNWDDAFAETGDKHGNLLRRVSGLILVKGITVEMTFYASFTQSEIQQFRSSSKEGVWPFYQKSSENNWDQNDDTSQVDSYNVTMKSGKDTILVLGILQTPAPNYFSS